MEQLATFIGLAAGFCTTIAFVPQSYKIYKTKHTKDLSLVMYIILNIGILLWLIYGIIIKDSPLITANGISQIFAVYILGMKIRHG